MSLPVIYVVRSDGEPLLVKSWDPDTPLPLFLADAMSKAGKVLAPKDAEKINKGLASAEVAMGKERYGIALERLLPVNKSGSFAEPARKVEVALKNIKSKGEEALNLAERNLASTEEAGVFEGVRMLVTASRQFQKIPELNKKFKEAISKAKKQPQAKTHFASAETLDKAYSLLEKEQAKKGREALKQVVEKYPDTPAAKAAQAKLDELDNPAGIPAEKATEEASPKKSQSKTDTSSEKKQNSSQKTTE